MLLVNSKGGVPQSTGLACSGWFELWIKVVSSTITVHLELALSRSCEAPAEPIVRKEFHSKGAWEGAKEALKQLINEHFTFSYYSLFCSSSRCQTHLYLKAGLCSPLSVHSSTFSPEQGLRPSGKINSCFTPWDSVDLQNTWSSKYKMHFELSSQHKSCSPPPPSLQSSYL